jgi:hypothetical protein
MNISIASYSLKVNTIKNFLLLLSMHPVFWEGKGNGKHEIEKFLQKKYLEFYV